jgi:hypothetical protein
VAGFHVCSVDCSGATIVLVTLLENGHSEDYDGQEQLPIAIWFSVCSEVRVRFPALRDFLRSSGSGTESTQPREYN